MVIGRLLSYWEGNFLGAMLNFGRVAIVFDVPSRLPSPAADASEKEPLSASSVRIFPPAFSFLVQFPVLFFKDTGLYCRGYPTKMSRLRGISISLFCFQEGQEERHTKTMNHWVIPCFLFRPDIHAN